MISTVHLYLTVDKNKHTKAGRTYHDSLLLQISFDVAEKIFKHTNACGCPS